jgi:hypothetical protein
LRFDGVLDLGVVTMKRLDVEQRSGDVGNS